MGRPGGCSSILLFCVSPVRRPRLGRRTILPSVALVVVMFLMGVSRAPENPQLPQHLLKDEPKPVDVDDDVRPGEDGEEIENPNGEAGPRDELGVEPEEAPRHVLHGNEVEHHPGHKEGEGQGVGVPVVELPTLAAGHKEKPPDVEEGRADLVDEKEPHVEGAKVKEEPEGVGHQDDNVVNEGGELAQRLEVPEAEHQVIRQVPRGDHHVKVTDIRPPKC